MYKNRALCDMGIKISYKIYIKFSCQKSTELLQDFLEKEMR